MSGYIQTFTGLKFQADDPQFKSLCIEDVAHALSMIPRFMGQTKIPYYVGNHCLNGSFYFEKRGMINEAKIFLVHENEESYLSDMPTPIKYLPQMSAYRSLGKGIKEAWYRKLKLFDIPLIIKELDTRLLVAEYKKFFDYQDEEWLKGFEGIDVSDIHIKHFKNWRTVERKFLEQYDKLFGKRV